MHYSLDFHRKILIFFLNQLIFHFLKKKIIFIDQILIFRSKTVLNKFCYLQLKAFELKIEIWSIKMIFFLKEMNCQGKINPFKKKNYYFTMKIKRVMHV